MTHGTRSIMAALAFAACALAVVVATQVAAGAYDADLGTTGDQAAHYVTSLMIRDYLAEAAGGNPMRFALDYYAHFPRVSLGHWPPFFHAVQALVALAGGRSVAAAIGFQAVVTAVLCTVTAAVVARRLGWLVAVAAGAAVFAIPTVMFLTNAVMIDNFLAVLTLGAVLAWARFVPTMDWRWSLAFGVLVSAAAMTKGTGYALALLPVFHAILARRLGLLLDWRSWLSAVPVVVVTLPWLVLTYRISADGFNYPWGWGYTGVALPSFANLAREMLGVLLLGLFACGFALAAWRGPAQDAVGTAMAGAVLAIAGFSVLVPADIQPRYLIPLVPPLVVVAADGAAWMGRTLSVRAAIGSGVRLGQWAAAVLLVVSGSLVVRLPHIHSMRMDDVAQAVLESGSANPIVLVVGWPNAEGALIAAFAERDTARRNYVVRGTKVLADGNFMGSDYRPRFNEATAMSNWIAQAHIGWVVLDTARESRAFAHVDQIAALAEAQGWTLVRSFDAMRGEVRLYALDRAPVPPAVLDQVMRQIQPKKVIGTY